MEKRPYLGSVRFYKNLILLAVILAILTPSALALRYYRTMRQGTDENTRLLGQLQEAQDSLAASADNTPLPAQELSSGAAASAEAEPISYQELYPDFYAPEPLNAAQSTSKTIYLTFDDGPSDRTDEILEILDRQGVKATFFVVGHTDETSLQRLRSIAEAGHTLGMHSYSHAYKTIYASVEDYLSDMYQLFCLIRDTTGVTPSVFRFPGGSINAYNHGIYQELLAEMLRRGFVPYDWNLSSGDATGSPVTPAQIVSNVVGSAGNVNRGFVLMHDAADKASTVKGLENMIVQLRGLGFSFDRITAEVKPLLFNYLE